MNLAERFAALAHRAGVTSGVAQLYRALAAAWAEPHRRYHTTEHLVDCLAQLDAAPDDGADRVAVEAALWFHDAVYQPGARDNEARSAEWAERALVGAGATGEIATEVARLVRLSDHAEPPTDPSGRLLCDVDLAILGSAPAAYAAYERGIRAEYAWVPEPEFRAGRRRVLERLLSRDPLFSTPHFRRRYETTARGNLARALERLSQD